MTASELRAAVKESGSHFFDRKTMQFFRSKIHNVYDGADGVFFVTSESQDDEPRRYTVRQWDEEGARVHTVGEFRGYRHREDAATAARRMAGRRKR